MTVADGADVKKQARTLHVRSPTPSREIEGFEPEVIIIGSGIGGLTTAADLTQKGVKVLVLEKYLIPGGSSGFFKRDDYTFDVGASMIFGLGERGTTNLLTRALDCVGKRVVSFPDPTQLRYHLPDGLDVRVWKDYDRFMTELCGRFPEEKVGIRKFYGECWTIFNALNSMELRSLEEPRYLLDVFSKHPKKCFDLLRYIAVNAGDVARKYIKNEQLLRFIDMECYCWSVAQATRTPMINAGMVFCDRHYGGINYPKGGVGTISDALVEGVLEGGGRIAYGKRVTRVLLDDFEKNAVGVQLADGSKIKAQVVVSNCTRWDTFGRFLPQNAVPETEKKFQKRYVKSPSFLSMHLGVRESGLKIDMTEAGGMDVHHIVLENWKDLEAARNAQGTIFVSIPSVLDKSVAPDGRHIFHIFTPSWMDEWENLSVSQYQRKKVELADRIIGRLESLFPGLSKSIEMKEIGTPRSHRRFLGREDGTYGPVPNQKLNGLISMPFNKTSIDGLYCVGDSCFPGQGLNAVAFSGFACAHRIEADMGKVATMPRIIDSALSNFLSKKRLELG